MSLRNHTSWNIGLINFTATCAATDLAILKPGVSRICSVCELRCLKVSELVRIAHESLGPEVSVGLSGEVCGGCGGKFLA